MKQVYIQTPSNRLLKVAVALGLVTLVGACSWVKPSEGSHRVVLAEYHQVSNCAKKGSTTSKTLTKVIFIPRSKSKIFSELVMLAKNEAAILEGDTIVPGASPNPGVRTFTVYNCNGPQ